MDDRTCPNCAEPVTGHGAKVYCSRRCSQQAGSRERGDRCSRCGCQMYWQPQPPPPGGRVCPPCRRARQNDPANVRACLDCGAEFKRWCETSNNFTALCRCRPCYRQWTRDKQTPRERQRIGKPAPTHGKPDGSAWRKARAQVIAEETHCGFCRELVDKSLRFPHRDSPSVDHIVPWTMGGLTYERSNLRLAHLGCNSSAGGRLSVHVNDERISLLRAAVWIGQRLR